MFLETMAHPAPGRFRRSTGAVRIHRASILPLYLLLSIFVLCRLGVAGDESTTGGNDGEGGGAGDGGPCRLYLAESHAGDLPLALYTGVPVRSGSYLTGDDGDGYDGGDGDGGDVGFHFVDILKHRESIVPDDLVELLWTPSEILSQWEDESEDSGLVMISGAGLAGVHNPGVYNARWDRSTLVDRYRPRDGSSNGAGGGALDARTDPGAGAASEFFDMRMTAVADLRAGTEIFPYFGATWMEAREEEAEEASQTDPPKYAKSHYDRADSITDDFARLVEKHADFFSEGETRTEFWDLIRNDVVTDRKVRRLLPDEADDVASIEDAGGSAYRANPGTVRSVEWLEENGQCVDALRGGPSTIPGAGRGAFARRPIAAGDVASPGPLIRFTLDQLEIPRPDDPDVVGSHQLLLNYCLAHPSNPRLLFFPHVSGSNLINHSSDRPNVEMRWSESPNHNPYPLGLSLDELLARPVLTGLSVDFVATRDIGEGEEVLLDYGGAWERAWADHVGDWAAPESGGEHDRATASVLNAADPPFPTAAERRGAAGGEDDAAPGDEEEEEEAESDGEMVFVVCSYGEEEEGKGKDGDSYRMDLGDAGTDALDSGGRIRAWRGGDGVTRKENRCEVLLRQEVLGGAEGEVEDEDEDGDRDGTGEPLYFVRLLSDVGVKSKRYLADVPHRAMTRVDAPYRGASHRPGSFRHPIGMPDGMFPRAWAAANPADDDGGGGD